MNPRAELRFREDVPSDMIKFAQLVAVLQSEGVAFDMERTNPNTGDPLGFINLRIEQGS